MSTPIAPIDWDSALEQCDGDTEFLEEILGDFTKESEAALNAIVEGMRTRQFPMVMKAGHQIKGSASYLSCGNIMRCASMIQHLGNEGTASVEAERLGKGMGELRHAVQIWEDVEEEYQNLFAHFQFLNRAVAHRFAS